MKSEVYKVLISCPGDLLESVNPIEKEIHNFNERYGERNGIHLRVVHWKKDSYPQVGGRPQDILNNQIVDNSDMCIALFWTRFGSKTEMYGSGTEEEIERMINRNKTVFLYFLDKPLEPSKIDKDQYEKVIMFKERNKNNVLYFEYSDDSELLEGIVKHLEKHFDNMKEIEKSESNKLILWVDDQPVNNGNYIDYFRDIGLEVDLALSTQRAESLLAKNMYSLVISDMGRKEGIREGYEILEKVKNNYKDTPVIFFTSDGSKAEYKEEAKSNGAIDSVDSFKELLSLVLGILKR